MKKALLIIDAPENCYECLLEHNNKCTAFADIRVESLGRPRWCPLRELPRLTDYDTAYNMWIKHSAIYRSGNNKNALYRFVDGWEGCLDELEGKYDK